MPMTRIGTDTYHSSSLNATSKVRNIVVYDLWDIDGVERFGDNDIIAASFSPWPNGGGHLVLSIMDKAPDDNTPDSQQRHQQAEQYRQGWDAFWTSALNAAGLPVVDKGSGAINPIPNDIEVWKYNQHFDSGSYRMRTTVFRSNNTSFVLLALNAQSDSEDELDDIYPVGRRLL